MSESESLYTNVKASRCREEQDYFYGNFTFSVLPILQLVTIGSRIVFNSLSIEICKLTSIPFFVFLGVLTFGRILLILLALIIAQRSTHFLEILSLCLYDQVSLMLEKHVCIQWMKLSHINDS